jgi:hypothetical protein
MEQQTIDVDEVSASSGADARGKICGFGRIFALNVRYATHEATSQHPLGHDQALVRDIGADEHIILLLKRRCRQCQKGFSIEAPSVFSLE